MEGRKPAKDFVSPLRSATSLNAGVRCDRSEMPCIGRVSKVGPESCRGRMSGHLHKRGLRGWLPVATRRAKRGSVLRRLDLDSAAGMRGRRNTLRSCARRLASVGRNGAAASATAIATRRWNSWSGPIRSAYAPDEHSCPQAGSSPFMIVCLPTRRSPRMSVSHANGAP